jgi:hypothetical protein
MGTRLSAPAIESSCQQRTALVLPILLEGTIAMLEPPGNLFKAATRATIAL